MIMREEAMGFPCIFLSLDTKDLNMKISRDHLQHVPGIMCYIDN